jgi:serine/threonine-protein kinase ATR
LSSSLLPWLFLLQCLTFPNSVNPEVVQESISAMWLESSKLARKAGDFHQAFNAVLNAREMGDQLAPVEHARLLWSDGQHRKAITILEGTITANLFRTVNTSFSFGDSLRESESIGNETSSQPQSHAKARVFYFPLDILYRR